MPSSPAKLTINKTGCPSLLIKTALRIESHFFLYMLPVGFFGQLIHIKIISPNKMYLLYLCISGFFFLLLLFYFMLRESSSCGCLFLFFPCCLEFTYASVSLSLVRVLYSPSVFSLVHCTQYFLLSCPTGFLHWLLEVVFGFC